MTRLAVVETSVGLRTAARLLVLRSREDVAGRRGLIRSDVPTEANITIIELLQRINADDLCLACACESATGRGLLASEHSCPEINPGPFIDMGPVSD